MHFSTKKKGKKERFILCENPLNMHPILQCALRDMMLTYCHDIGSGLKTLNSAIKLLFFVFCNLPQL